MLVTKPRYLPLTIDVLDDIEYVHFPASGLGFDKLVNLPVHVELDFGLRKGQDKFHLLYNTSVDD